MSDLSGKVALVTGAGSGIGRASSLLMAARGAVLAVTDLNLDAANAVSEEIRAAGGTSRAFRCNLESEEDITLAVELTTEHFGRLDIMFNNAALIAPDIYERDSDILSVPTEVWDRTMAVTLRGTMFGCRYGARAMIRSGGGSIINTSSIFGISAHNRNIAYGVAKGAINTLTTYVATSLGRHGIRCNGVAPSLIMTPTGTTLPAELKKIHEDSTLTGFLGEPRDVAEVVAFLASDGARFVTGHIIPVDGGTLAHLPTYAGWRQELGEP